MPSPSDGLPAGNSATQLLLTQMEYARRRGWSKQYINQLVKQGRIQLANGRIDPVAADAALAGTRDPSRGSRVRMPPEASPLPISGSPAGSTPVGGAEGTFVKARTVREHFRAMREKMEFEAATGELVRRREVEDAAYGIGVTFRQHMMRAAESIGLAVASRFRLAERDVSVVITDGITQALRQLHDAIRGDEWGFDNGMDEDTPLATGSVQRSETVTDN